MATSTVEDYIKQIYLEQIESADGPVTMGRVAISLGVLPGYRDNNGKISSRLRAGGL
jgi:Mn-dependent DtxR family transcriptional regulator